MKISIYIATSANGLISNSRNVPDWLSPEYEQGFMEICQRTKAVIMGRTTYDILAPDYLPLKDSGTTVVLTSNTQLPPPNPTVLFTNHKAVEIVSLLKQKGHSEAVIIGGALTMSEFMNAGLVDDIYFVMEPVLFGSGLPLLKNVAFESKLSLIDVAKLNKATIQVHYEIEK